MNKEQKSIVFKRNHYGGSAMKTKKYWFDSQVFYRSCLNSDQQPHRNGAKKIEEIIRKVGGWNLTKTDGQIFIFI